MEKLLLSPERIKDHTQCVDYAAGEQPKEQRPTEALHDRLQRKQRTPADHEIAAHSNCRIAVKVDSGEGDADCGGLISYNYISGEPVTGLADGRPLVVRSANNKFNLANFMRAHLYGAIGVLKVGNDVLLKEENVKVDRITGHGGYFTTPGVGQRMLAAALNSPISVMETAGEGGAWGIALLAAYAVNNTAKLSLADYLDQVVFAGNAGTSIAPTPEEVDGFNRYLENYKADLAIEQAAVENHKL